jgi:hypothetical protein
MEVPTKDLIVRLIRETIDLNGSIPNTLVFARSNNFSHDEVVGAANSLAANEKIILSKPQTQKGNEITAEGNLVLANGSPEYICFQSIPTEGTKTVSGSDIGVIYGLKNGWIKMEKGNASRKVVEVTEDIWRVKLANFQEGKDIDKKDLDNLKKNRKWIVEVYVVQNFIKLTSYIILNVLGLINILLLPKDLLMILQ